MLDSNLQEQFIQLIKDRTGLKIRSQDWAMLSRSILERMNALHIRSPHHYYELLGQSATNTRERRNNEAEWEVLTNFITTGESYFWRDRGQLRVLCEHILPEIIQTKRAKAKQGEILQLRLWSAGCSTGEEPYTLATILQDLIPDLHQWNVLILGTDLNPEVIRKAKQGIYRQWSFRQTPVDFQRQYFQNVSGAWQVKDKIRRAVTFRCGNLLQDDFPSVSDIHNMDLILCRNVFIYFHAESITTVLQKFYKTLNPAGYLMCGHAELQAQDLSAFQLFSFPEAIVYQRPVNQVLEPVIHALPQPISRPSVIKLTPSEFCSASGTISDVDCQGAQPVDRMSKNLCTETQSKLSNAEALPATPAISPRTPFSEGKAEGPSAKALAYVSQKQYAQALQCCDTALQIDPDSNALLYLQAQIYVTLENFKLAKALLKKIIYLSPCEIAAYLELGALYVREEDRYRANKVYESAKRLLQEKSNSPTLRYQEFLTNGELKNHIEQQLKKVN
jgi:chemotaxis protein methyltransferase CheR